MLAQQYKALEDQNEKLSINIKSFKSENSMLKRTIHKDDNTRHNPRGWLKKMQLHIREQMGKSISILSKTLKSKTFSQYANDPEFLKFSKFVEWSNRFKAFINSFAKIKFEDDSELWDKWEKNNGKENVEALYELSKIIGEEDIDVEQLVNEILKLEKDLDMHFTSVYEFVKREIENYEHYVKEIRYSERITEIEEKIGDLEGYHIPKYGNSISYDNYLMKIKEYESRLSR